MRRSLAPMFPGILTRSSLVDRLGEPNSQGNVREAGETPSIVVDGELVLLHQPVPDIEPLIPGRRHYLVWYCSGGTDVFLNCYATGNARHDQWALRHVCPRHRDLS